MKDMLKKRVLALMLTIPMVLSVSCKNEEDKITETNQTILTEDTTADTATIQTTSFSTETSEPTELTQATTYIDGVGEVYVRNSNYLSKEDFNSLWAKIRAYGDFSLGIDNPKILEIAREYFNNDSLTLEDIGFFQCDLLDDSDINKKFYIDLLSGYCINSFSRYFLSLNGDRFMENHIDNRFFHDYFPEYSVECDKGNARKIAEEYLSNNPYYTMLLQINDSSGLSKFMSNYKDEPEAQEAMKYFIFYCLQNYDTSWGLSSGSYSTLYGFLPLTRETDGNITIVYNSTTTFDKLQSVVNSMPNCENLDITKPETYEDLVNSGVDVDVLERAIKYAGLDIPLLSETNNI